MNFFRSARFRLTLIQSSVLTLLVIVFSGLVFMMYRSSLYREFDVKLRNDLENSDDRIAELIAGKAIESDPENWLVEVWSTTNNERVYSSTAVGDYPLGRFDPSCRMRFEPVNTKSNDGVELRVFCQDSSSLPGKYTLRVARVTEKLDQSLNELLRLLLMGIPAILVLSALFGYLLARRILSPIAAMNEAARRISGSRFSERLPVFNSQDELGQLAMAFNETFDRLEVSFQQAKRFSSDASHELRTPLSAIRALGETALRNPGNPKFEPYSVISSILEETDRLNQLCESLLFLSKVDAGQISLKREPVNLNALMDEVVDLLSVLAEEKGQRLEKSAANELIKVTGDSQFLRQALVNLIENAIKYSPSGSSIHVRASVKGASASVEVIDEGQGIPKEYREKIFERFFRTDQARQRKTGGAGLGLSIGQWIARLHDGEIRYRSNEPKGSIFELTLPQESA